MAVRAGCPNARRIAVMSLLPVLVGNNIHLMAAGAKPKAIGCFQSGCKPIPEYDASHQTDRHQQPDRQPFESHVNHSCK